MSYLKELNDGYPKINIIFKPIKKNNQRLKRDL